MKDIFHVPKWYELIGRSPEYIFYKGLPRIYAEYLRSFTMLEVEGLENVPKRGKVILIPNHSGILGWDAAVLHYEMFKSLNRLPRTMAHSFWSSNDFLRAGSEKLGFFSPDFKKAVRYLKKNKLMIIFPEAEQGNFKPSIKMYQLMEFNPGFVALAMITNAPVVPVCILGAEENYINLGTVSWLEKSIGVRLPIPLNLLPIPSKWKIKFLSPLSFSKYNKKDIKNEKFVKEVADNIKFRIQANIQMELVQKGIFKF